MGNKTITVTLFGALLATGASAFNLNLSYRDGYVGTYTDAFGNTSTMNSIAKMDSADPVLTRLDSIVTGFEPTWTTSVGTEVSGDIDIDRLAGNNYGISAPNVFLGSEIQLRLNTTESVDNLRWVWLTSLNSADGSQAIAIFANDRFYRYGESDEVNHKNGDDYAYNLETNLGFGLPVGTNARVTTWEILVETTPGSSGSDVKYRGGVRYDYDVAITAVPEPGAMLGLALPLALLTFRRRKA